jgi:hypothetical protein
MSEPSTERETDDAAPPFGRSWAPLYAIVVVNLAFWIALFAVFTRALR